MGFSLSLRNRFSPLNRSSHGTPSVEATIENLTESGVNVVATISTIHTIYLVVLLSGSDEPLDSQIAAGTDANDDPAVFSKYGIGTSVPIPVIELLPSTAYDIYVVGKHSDGNYTNIVPFEITTTAFSRVTASGAYFIAKGDDYNDSTDEWTNSVVGSPITKLQAVGGRNTPTKLTADINGHDVVNFVAASHQLLESNVAWDSVSTDATLYIVAKFDIYQSGVIFSNYDTGAAYVNTGFGIVSRTTGMRGLIRNGSVASFDPPLTDTASYHILCIKTKDLGSGASELLCKVDGRIAIISGAYAHNLLATPMAAPTNKIRIGSSWDNVSFDGKIAEVCCYTERHGFVDERNVFNELCSDYNLAYTLQRDTDFTGFIAIDGTTSKEFNGLDYIRRSDNKFDLITATIQGDLMKLTQTGVNTFDNTSIASSIGEIQSTRYKVINGTPYAFNAHKVLGKVSMRTLDNLTVVDLITGINEPQDLKWHDIDGDGVEELIISYQGTDNTDGGIIVADPPSTGESNPANWTLTEHPHPAAWWQAGITIYQGAEVLIFSARNNGVNSGQIPGIYRVPIINYGTALWSFGTEETITNIVKDYLHVRFGDLLGNGNDDVIFISNTTDAAVICDGADHTQQTTLSSPDGKPWFNAGPIEDVYGDGRDAILLTTQLSSGAGHYTLNRWNPITATRFNVQLKATNNHPGDNEIIPLDVYNEGKLRLVLDDSENLVDGHVYVAGVL